MLLIKVLSRQGGCSAHEGFREDPSELPDAAKVVVKHALV
jgi:hypothetical protein